MNARCSKCRLVYEREQGYFLGAMVFSYFFACASTVPTIIVLVFAFHASTAALILIPTGQLILMNPLLFRLSRLVWLYVDQRSDPR